MDRSYKREGVEDFSQRERAEWNLGWDLDYSMALEDFHIERSQHWWGKAERMLVEEPPESKEDQFGTGYWDSPRHTQRVYRFLTDKGVAYVRQAIREEQIEHHRFIRGHPLFTIGVSVGTALIVILGSRLIG